MCITMRVAWLTIDRLRSGRDIRLSTATMRALNSRRPRSTTSIHRLVPRSAFCFLLLLCVLHVARARSVLHDDGDGVAADQTYGKISEPVEVSDSDPDDVEDATKDTDQARRRSLTLEGYDRGKDDSGEEGKNPAKEVSIQDPEKIQTEAIGDESSVAKKRRRNDVILPDKSALQNGESVAQDVEENAQKNEGIRRFDAQVESDDTEELDQHNVSDDIIEDISDSQVDDIEHDERLTDLEQSRADIKSPGGEERAEPEEEKYTEISSDFQEDLGNVASSNQAQKTDLNQEETGQIENLAEHNLDGARIEDTDDASDEVRNELRSLHLIHAHESESNQDEHVGDEAPSNEEIGVDDPDPNRENRHLTDASGKPKYKSSTVYLNAEEGNQPGREQESIVDGQIKKLISIRDDVLETAGNDAKQPEKLDEESLLSEKSIDIDVTAVKKNEGVRSQRSSDARNVPIQSEDLDQPSATTEIGPNRFQKWRDQAALLQEQIKNRTFLYYLRDQAIEVLPGIPKFTENQLLDTLKSNSLLRKPPSNETYWANLNATELSQNQLEIIKCAEQLVETKQRQTFVENMAECIRGLSVLNCMRIFVWPVMLENLPDSVKETLNNLPIEISLIDLFQGNRTKSARSEGNVHRARLLTPESVVFNILKGALESKATFEQAPIYIDSSNETLRRLLTFGQLQILQMAERLLPGEIRREYSDRMFSCVRRFEYFSCVKYFAWPMVKQYYPALPAFPDYQSWYPSIALYPQYPIVPFPSFVEATGELPEVVEADATRRRRPRPEAVIVNILRNTLREHAKVPPPSVAYNTDSYIALLPPEQLLSIRMAEQLLPVPYRPEFVQKTVKCIQEYNYVTCIKYSTWPMVRQFTPSLPSLPDLSGWIPNWQLPDVFGYLPEFSLPSIPDFSSFIPGLGSGGGTSPTTEQPPASGGSAPEESSGRFPTILLRQHEIPSKASNELENKITNILTRVHDSLRAIPENPQVVISGNVIILTTSFNEKQVNILKLAESIVPPPARAPLVNQVLSCLENNDFFNCTRYVIWPTVALYVPNFPEFPDLPPTGQPSKQEDQTPLKDKNTSNQSIKDQQEWDKSQNEENSNIKIISRTKFQQSNSPVISVTGTRFVPIFTEHPESMILNILRSIELSSPNVRDGDDVAKVTISSQQFGDLLNDRQLNILRITESLLPDAARPAFLDRMTQCIRKSNFLVCSRNVLWPILSDYFPRLPSFPNFDGHPQAINSKSALPQNLTDPSPFSETDVKVGQHGDATVTITDTRFFPIFSEHPEGIILRILVAVQNSVPGVLASSITSRVPGITTYLTEQQANIVQVAESLIPESVRPVFVEKMVACVQNNVFLQCTRDILWPTVAQFFPRLPNFPNFGSYQTLPRTKLDLSSILLRNAYSENQTSNEKSQSTPKTVVETIEDKIENVLKDLLSKDSTARSGNSYLDVNNPAIGALLTAREMNIVQLTESAIPDSIRRAYIINMLECVRSNNFMTCTQQVSWPTLKQFLPSLPNFEQLLGQFPIPGAGQIPIPGQIPGIGQIPDIAGQLPPFPGAGNPFAEGPSIPSFPPQIPMIPGGLPQLPGGLPQLPGGLPQLPGGLPQLPGVPQFPGIPGFPGGINFPPPQFGILSDAPQQESEPQEQSKITPAEAENQISGVTRAANTPSVDEQRIVPGYLGQPSHILIDISKEKVHLSDIEQQRAKSSDASSTKHKRRRRSADQLLNPYYETDKEVKTLEVDSTFPNITESEFLQLLINVSNSKIVKEPAENQKKHLADILNSTIMDSLTDDQLKIIEIVEDLSLRTGKSKILWEFVTQCIISMSFRECMRTYIGPLVTVMALSTPSFGIFKKSAETEADFFFHFFGMSTSDFEKELLTRKESMENILLDWYKKAMEEKFQTNVGFLKIKGYGNGELGISFGGFREGRATKIKDNKNLPSILTIISDIMEEVLDQRPDNEKIKKEKEKRERSLDDVQETNFQLLKESDETDIKRSINDDQIITMFLDKIKANATDFADGDVAQFLNVEDAHNAFGVLFGTRLNEKFANRLKAFTEEHLKKDKSEGAKESNVEELKVIPLKEKVAYDLEKESTESHEERKREHRAKNEFRSLLDEYSDKLARSVPKMIEDPDDENKIKDTESLSDKNTRSELRIRLPLLREDIISRKGTNAIMNLGRVLKTKMSTIMPGIGFIITFFIQMALAHARAAASMAGMISNMAFASALFGMLRQNLFGSDNPKIKYVYDNDKTGPGITWPHHHRSYYHGK